MRVVVIGSGGREHALAWKVAQSERVDAVLCMPGNGGTALDSALTNVPFPGVGAGSADLDAAAVAVERERPDLVVIGPEAPLVAGLAEALRQRGILVVGPNADGARLEGSKAFAKSIMERSGVPTARAIECRDMDEVEAGLAQFPPEDPPVVKADGLAAGKGVVVCETADEARGAARAALVEGRFGEAGRVLLLEERLRGVEASYIVLTDGRGYASFPTTQDHKRLLDGDLGPNTGGMGAYLPNPFIDATLDLQVRSEVIEPVLTRLRSDGIDYRGFLYAGLMLTNDGPKVLEFNVRSGDPETQPIMFGLEQDLVPTLVAVAEGNLVPEPLTARPTAAVVLASGGYPGSYTKGRPIAGLDRVADVPDVHVFHAGTRLDDEDRVVTSGGRVLAVTARAVDLPDALRRAYEAVDHLSFTGAQHRRDIGSRAL